MQINLYVQSRSRGHLATVFSFMELRKQVFGRRIPKMQVDRVAVAVKEHRLGGPSCSDSVTTIWRAEIREADNLPEESRQKFRKAPAAGASLGSSILPVQRRMPHRVPLC